MENTQAGAPAEMSTHSNISFSSLNKSEVIYACEEASNNKIVQAPRK